MFLVDNYEKLCNKQDLKDMLIEMIEEDLLNNTSDYDIVKSDLKQLKRIYADKMNCNEIIEELKLYGFSITKLSELLYDLGLLQDYLKMNNKEEYKKIDDTIKIVKELKGV